MYFLKIGIMRLLNVFLLVCFSFVLSHSYGKFLNYRGKNPESFEGSTFRLSHAELFKAFSDVSCLETSSDCHCGLEIL